MPSNYEILYFELHGLALTTRSLLSLGGFEWKNKFPQVSFISIWIWLLPTSSNCTI
jgi:hypothetical protein